MKYAFYEVAQAGESTLSSARILVDKRSRPVYAAPLKRYYTFSGTELQVSI